MEAISGSEVVGLILYPHMAFSLMRVKVLQALSRPPALVAIRRTLQLNYVKSRRVPHPSVMIAAGQFEYAPFSSSIYRSPSPAPPPPSDPKLDDVSPPPPPGSPPPKKSRSDGKLLAFLSIFFLLDHGSHHKNRKQELLQQLREVEDELKKRRTVQMGTAH